MWGIVKSLQDANAIIKFRRGGKTILNQLHCGKRWMQLVSRILNLITDLELGICETTYHNPFVFITLS